VTTPPHYLASFLSPQTHSTILSSQNVLKTTLYEPKITGNLHLIPHSHGNAFGHTRTPHTSLENNMIFSTKSYITVCPQWNNYKKDGTAFAVQLTSNAHFATPMKRPHTSLHNVATLPKCGHIIAPSTKKSYLQYHSTPYMPSSQLTSHTPPTTTYENYFSPYRTSFLLNSGTPAVPTSLRTHQPSLKRSITAINTQLQHIIKTWYNHYLKRNSLTEFQKEFAIDNALCELRRDRLY